MNLFWKIIDRRAAVPRRAYRSAGYDLFPIMEGLIGPGQTEEIRLGLASAFDDGYVGIIDDRGSTGRNHITHLAGVIDSDYRGEWILFMHNLGSEPFKYSPAKAIAQVMFVKLAYVAECVVTELPPSVRGAKGFGSSDEKGV